MSTSAASSDHAVWPDSRWPQSHSLLPVDARSASCVLRPDAAADPLPESSPRLRDPLSTPGCHPSPSLDSSAELPAQLEFLPAQMPSLRWPPTNFCSAHPEMASTD